MTEAAASPYDIHYARLPKECFAQVAPTPVSQPTLLRLNDALAEELGLSPEDLRGPEGVATLAGNRPLDGVAPIAMAYAGHQFGNWVPSLGDGRAVLIGEAVARDGERREIQLKGAGRTPFSRGGDGRAALGPVLREYVLCEAMHALGIPTTRALAMVETGDTILREREEAGAILVRTARGHVRVGTFQYFHARGMTDAVRALADHVIARRYPEAREAANPYRALLDGVIAAQAELITRWLLVGFIHGVMNTDNMSIFGETIDYGPCAFMDGYEPGKVYSSIDHAGRYAYDQQPGIGLWNLTRFAETLLPLLADEPSDAEGEDAGVAVAQDALAAYRDHFQRGYDEGLCRKLGLRDTSPANLGVVSGFLDLMAAQQADFTLSFRRLCEVGDTEDDTAGLRALFEAPEALDPWLAQWRAALALEGRDTAERQADMRRANPAFIPRNHRVQEAIEAAAEGDLSPLDQLCQVTARPFEDQPEFVDYTAPPEAHEIVERTFCGT